MTKSARSMLFYAPRAYRWVHSGARARLQYQLGIPHERDFRALKVLFPGGDPLVIDVGANIGQSVYSIKAMLPAARIVSFEPHPETARQLKSLEARFSDVRVEAVGLGAEPGSRDIFTPVYRTKRMPALASFDILAAEQWLNRESIFWFSPGHLRLESARVEVRTLDSFQLDPDFIKIDVQGTEDEVIRGALTTIERRQPVIMAEGSESGVGRRTLMKDMGYTIMEFSGRDWRPYRAALNFFLIPPGRG